MKSLKKIILNIKAIRKQCFNINASSAYSLHSPPMLKSNQLSQEGPVWNLRYIPACLHKQGTFCAQYGFTSTLLVRCVTNLRSWFSQLSILIFQVQIPLCVTCNFIEEEKKQQQPGTWFWIVIEIFSLLLINGVK